MRDCRISGIRQLGLLNEPVRRYVLHCVSIETSSQTAFEPKVPYDAMIV